MLVLNWYFAFFWTVVGVTAGAIALFAGVGEPLVGYLLVTIIMVVPLAALDLADRRR